MIENAAAIADVPISEEYKEMMLENLTTMPTATKKIYKLHIPNSVDPALIFDPVLRDQIRDRTEAMRISKAVSSATAGCAEES